MTINYSISQYTPRGIDKTDWQTVSEFVQEIVADVVTPEDDHRSIVRLMGIVTRLSIWVNRVNSLPLTREIVLDHDMIENFISSTNLTKSVKGSYRSELIAIGRALNPEWDGDTGAPRYGASASAEPYSKAEVTRLQFWARGLRTDYQRETAEVILALGLGAGLRPGEIATVRVSDVLVTNDYVSIFPSGYRGSGPRETVVLADYEDTITSQVERYEPDTFLAMTNRSKAEVDLLWSFIQRAGTPEDVDVSLARMRSTWIVRLMDSLIPDSIITSCAGLSDLQHYRSYRPRSDVGNFRQRLRTAS